MQDSNASSLTLIPEAQSPSRESEAMVLPGWPHFASDEIAVAAKVLSSGRVNYWTGDEGRAFEKEFAAYLGCRYAVALANGTVAIELALRALEIGAGDEVIVPSRTFFATASAVVAVGARPVFAEVDRNSQTVSAETLRAAMTPQTRAFIVVHLAGWPCDMPPILRLAADHGIRVIEDCAQAHGAALEGKKAGTFGDVAAFSFCQDKIMTTAGEGGMVVTDSRSLWDRMWAYKDHGKSYAAVYERAHAPGFRWLHESFGTNWRLSEVQSAVGRRQLSKLPASLAQRRHNASTMLGRFRQLKGLRVPIPGHGIEHAFYKVYVFVEAEHLARDWSRDRIAAELQRAGVPCQTGSCSEVYLEAAFPTEWRPQQRLPVAKELGDTSLMFQVHPTLLDEHVDWMCRVVERVMLQAVDGDS
jgi:dTDP-4-amino-4,6-dideoxygalactose transaminase